MTDISSNVLKLMVQPELMSSTQFEGKFKTLATESGKALGDSVRDSVGKAMAAGFSMQEANKYGKNLKEIAFQYEAAQKQVVDNIAKLKAAAEGSLEQTKLKGQLEGEMRDLQAIDKRFKGEQKIIDQRKKSAETMTEGMDAGLSVKGAEDYADRMMKANKEIDAKKIEVQEKVQKLQDSHISAQEKMRIRRQLKADKKAIRAMKFKYRKEGALVDELSRREDKSWVQSIEEGAEKLSGGLGSIFSTDLSGIVQGFGTQMKGMGKAAEKGAATRAGAGGAEGALGGLLKGLGPVLTTIGSLSMAMIGVVKLLFDASNEGKEFNASLFETGITVGEMTRQFGKFEDVFEGFGSMHQRFQSMTGLGGELTDWELEAKELNEIVGGLHSAGLTVEKLTGHTKDLNVAMRSVKGAADVTMTYSKSFGISVSEMTGNMGDWFTGLGENVDSLRYSLARVHMAATTSGYSTKQFFSLVGQATADMTMYNVRLEQAGALLLKMGKALGLKGAGEQLQKLGKGFEEEGYQERFQRVMITPEMQKLFQWSAEGAATAYVKKLGGLGRGEGGEDLRSALSEALGTQHITAKTLVEGFKQMSPAKFGSLWTKAQLSGNEEMVRLIQPLWEASRGATGREDLMVQHMGALDQATQAIAEISKAEAFLGVDLFKGGVLDDMAAQKIQGKSGVEFKTMKILSRAFVAPFEELKKIAKGPGEMGDEEKKRWAKQHGAIVEGGKIYTASVDKSGKVLKGVLVSSWKEMAAKVGTSSSDVQRALNKKVPEMERLAKEQVNASTSITTTLKRAMGGVLTLINSSVQEILKIMQNAPLFGDGLTVEGRKEAAKQKAYEKEQAAKEKADADKRAAKNLDRAKVLANMPSQDIGGHLLSNDRAMPDLDLSGQPRPDLGKGPAGALDLVKNAPPFVGGGRADDFLVQLSGSGAPKHAQRIHQNDIAAVGRAGGAMSMATAGIGAATGGGGGNRPIVVIHAYNDGKSTVRNALSAVRAGLIRA